MVSYGLDSSSFKERNWPLETAAPTHDTEFASCMST